MKIPGEVLKEKLDKFNANHRVDVSCEYSYESIEDSKTYDEKKEFLRKNNLNNARSVVIDGIHHFWKPTGDEALVKKEYVEKEEKKKSDKSKQG
jgi:hypothetical protein